MRGDIPALVALSKRGSKAGGLAGGGTSATVRKSPSKPVGRASGGGRILRRQAFNQDLKKAFSAESVSCGFSSGRK
jgi:hypothetical protein